MESNKQGTEQSSLWYDRIFSKSLGGIIAIVALVVFFAAIFVFFYFRSWEYTDIIDEGKIGQFGDFIGGVVGTLLAFVAAILYYVALREQSRDVKINQTNLELQTSALNQQIEEFKAQKVELEETRKVYENQTLLFREQTSYYKIQADEIKNQTTISYNQLFSSNFYSLLSVFISIQKDLKNDTETVFDSIYSKLQKEYDKSPSESITTKYIVDKYMHIYLEYNEKLSQYFKTLYHMLLHIENDNRIKDEIKFQYARILRSQLSDKELIILFYNYLSDYGLKARGLVVKYNLLKHTNKIDKIEIGLEPSEHRNELSVFLKKISLVISENLCKYSDIEFDGDIRVSEAVIFLSISSSYKLEIKDNILIFDLIFSKSEFESQSIIDRNKLRTILLNNLYDVLFIANFKFPNYDEIEKSIIEKDNAVEFNYKLLKVENI